MILVIGGRSKIAGALIESLRARGERVRTLVRAHEADAAFRADVEAVVGDFGEPGSLRAAMSGAEKVFLLSSPHRDAVRWHCNAIDAARESGVGLLVRSSIIGANLESPAEFVSAHRAGSCPRTLQLADELSAVAGSQAGDDGVDVLDGECDMAATRSVGRRVPVVALGHRRSLPSFEVVADDVEEALPALPLASDPVRGLGERLRPQGESVGAPVDHAGEHPSLLEHFEVPRDSRL